jgi:hypothetical protein
MKININANASSSHHVVLRGIGDDFGGAVGGKAGAGTGFFPGFFLGFFSNFFSDFFSDLDAMKYLLLGLVHIATWRVHPIPFHLQLCLTRSVRSTLGTRSYSSRSA